MDILAHPNAALKQHAEHVDPATDSDLKELCRTMAKAMYEAPGIGLAAPQIGVMKRVIVCDLHEEGAGAVALCNPEILEFSEEREVDDEGCLSLPGITVPVERACRVVCRALTLSGREVRIDAEGLNARLLQHEIDHLDGVLMIDRATPEERKAALRRYIDVQLAGAAPADTGL